MSCREMKARNRNYVKGKVELKLRAVKIRTERESVGLIFLILCCPPKRLREFEEAKRSKNDAVR